MLIYIIEVKYKDGMVRISDKAYTDLESAQRFVLERSGHTSTPQVGYYRLTSNQGITYTIKDVTVDQ